MGEVIKNRSIIEDDVRHLADDEQATGGNFTVSLTRWLEEREQLKNVEGIGVRIASDEPIEPILDDISSLDIIALDFPKFADGRSYSKARLLRERFNYQGELRATGDILRDQLFYLCRCGFDTFELAQGNIRDALKGFNDFSITYQTAADGTLPVYLSEQRV